MQTLYIDVYFLINFTVDILAIYFAVSFSSVPTTRLRLVLGAIMGAVFATLAIFIDDGVIKLLCALSFSFIIALISVRGASFFRRFKFFFAFLVFETLIGGVVYFGYSLLDKHLYKFLQSVDGGGENRNLLIISIVILLSLGVFKLFIAVFTSRGVRGGSAELEVSLLGKKTTFGAFVDSGNLLCDPMDMKPIMLIKEGLAKKMLPSALISGNISLLGDGIKPRVRLIPQSGADGVKLLMGVRPDCVKIIKKNKTLEDIDVIIAIDKEGGTYGGYEALLPSSVTEDVI